MCLASARVVRRYVLDAIDSPDLRFYVVWGPMLGEESREDTGPATVHLAGDRVTHFWTPGHDLAEAFAGVLGLPEGEPAWDTFLLFAPGAAWGEAGPPAPAFFMHVGRSLPEDRRLDAEILAREARRLLEGGGAEGRESRGSGSR